MSKRVICIVLPVIIFVLTASPLHAEVDLRLNSVDVRTPQAYVGQRIYADFSVTTLTEASGDKTFWINIEVLTNPNDLGSSVYSIVYGSGYFPPEPGETKDTYYLSFELNALVDPGNYYIHVTLTPASPPDTNPADNAKSSTTFFNVPPRSGPADVLATDCRINNHYLKDRSQPISGITGYLNNSLSSASDVTVGIYLSLDTEITAGDILVAKENIGTLADPYYRTMIFSVPIDPDIPDGYYYAGALVSSSNDSNSANNVSLDGYPITIGGPPKPKPGTLTVYFSPAAVQDKAGWRLVGEDGWLKHGQSRTSLPPDEYKIEFRPVAGYPTPVKRTVEIKSGSGEVLNVSYLAGMTSPFVETFVVLPNSIYPREPARLVWKVRNVDSVNILPVLGLRTEFGSYPVETPESTTFRLSASNSKGSVNKTTKLRVINRSKIELFTSNSTESNPLQTSEKVKLYWVTRGISDITIDTDEDGFADFSTQSPFGVREVTLDRSGYARLSGQNGRRNPSAETYVHMTNLPVIRSFELSPNCALVGENVELHWKIPGMKTATIEPFGFNVDQEEGVYQFIATTSMEISITAVNEFGSVRQSRNLKVDQKSCDLSLQVRNLDHKKDGQKFMPFKDETEFNFEISITNIGHAKARNFFVSLYDTGRLVARKLIKGTLRPGKSIDTLISYKAYFCNKIPMKIVVDAEGVVPDVNRENNLVKFQIFAPLPKRPEVWIREVELRPVGTADDERVVMLNFRITHLGVRGRVLYFYRVKFFNKNARGDEVEVARLEGFPDERAHIGNRIDVMRLFRLDEEAFDGRIEIMVVNLLENNEFMELSCTRSFPMSDVIQDN